ncbi:MAG: hypothetical protein LBF22_06605 [Deltaproteobacteria bacterium]|jgi:hypothetical protein|nr:hypothetical protein [Deltaproteobacteria bacterium]
MRNLIALTYFTKNFSLPLFLVFSFLSALIFPPLQLQAHGVEWIQEPNEATIVISFAYDDGTPMNFCEFSLWGPGDTEIEFQKARTDKRGYFSFLPNEPGIWKFEVSDGQGHLAKGQIEVAPLQVNTPATQLTDAPAGETLASPVPKQPPSQPLAQSRPSRGRTLPVILGLSIILNVALIISIFRGRKIKTIGENHSEQISA